MGSSERKNFKTPPQNVNELRERVVENLKPLRGEPLKIVSAIREIRKRANLCINNNGRRRVLKKK